ncbi:hypothetical protein EsH8_XV_000013 [Colletotrichum jinshuiense]
MPNTEGPELVLPRLECVDPLQRHEQVKLGVPVLPIRADESQRHAQAPPLPASRTYGGMRRMLFFFNVVSAWLQTCRLLFETENLRDEEEEEEVKVHTPGQCYIPSPETPDLGPAMKQGPTSGTPASSGELGVSAFAMGDVVQGYADGRCFLWHVVGQEAPWRLRSRFVVGSDIFVLLRLVLFMFGMFLALLLLWPHGGISLNMTR